jgi:hypothetical protein
MWTFSCVAVAGVEVEVAMPNINWSVTRQQPGIDIVFVVAVVEASSPLPWSGLVALTQRSRGNVLDRKEDEVCTLGVLVFFSVCSFCFDVEFGCCAVDFDYRIVRSSIVACTILCDGRRTD